MDSENEKNERRAEKLLKKSPPSVFVNFDALGVHLECRDVSDETALAIFKIMGGTT
jgi:hypothetical protein